MNSFLEFVIECVVFFVVGIFKVVEGDIKFCEVFMMFLVYLFDLFNFVDFFLLGVDYDCCVVSVICIEIDVMIFL